MKKAIARIGRFVFLMGLLVSMALNVHADVDWTLIKQIDLDVQPLDIVVSEDGKMVFVLSAGEILVYSPPKNRIENRIPIDKEFDRVTYSGQSNTLILSSTSGKMLRIMRVDQIYPIDISGLPIKGPANAPVTIAVFDDYQ